MSNTNGEAVINEGHFIKLVGDTNREGVYPIDNYAILRDAMAIALVRTQVLEFGGLHRKVHGMSADLMHASLDSKMRIREYVSDLILRTNEPDVQEMIKGSPVLSQLAVKLADRVHRRKAGVFDRLNIYEGLARTDIPFSVDQKVFESLEAVLPEGVFKWDVSFRIRPLRDALFSALIFKYSKSLEVLKPLLDKLKGRSINESLSHKPYVEAIFERAYSPEFSEVINNTSCKNIGLKLSALAEAWVEEHKGKHLPTVVHVSEDLFKEVAFLDFPRQ